MAHLKKWKLLPNEKQSEAKKEEIPQNPNDKEQNTIVEDKKELVEDKKETVIVAPEYTKLTNEKEPGKQKRRTAKNDE